MTDNQNRVCCLYRVSTDKQVDFNSNHEADLPMQRKACHRFAEEKGWVIVHEEQEEGVSGHKVRAAARDKLQIIKDYARQGKFDILLVFMFDRIGRIADETPFVVEWFVRNGIRVWSTQEGEQRFDNHTDKLLNYIRFWQADGESEKTSVRTRTSLRQLVEEGHFKGGNAPYGYDLVRSGRTNKRKHELYELRVNEAEAAVVRLVFDKYVYEGYGVQRIAGWLNSNGYRARSGKCWHPASLRGMVANLTYTGVLRCGEARSEMIPELQIIPQHQFEAAQRIRESRSAQAAKEAEHHVPMNTRGQSLLSGNIYCGHCGSKLMLTASRKYREMADGTVDKTLRIRYSCYGKRMKQTECTGQTGYTTQILDGIIDKLVRQVFARMKGIPKEQLITRRYQKELVQRKLHLKDLEAQREKSEKDLLALKTEVLACIRGESAFSREMLAEMIAAQEARHKELEALCESASAELAKTEELLAEVSRQYDELISYADLYQNASFEAKKMIVNQLIRRVDVYRGYQIHVTFNFNLAQYFDGLDTEVSAG
ncbi:MAG: recombinase family protein [Faecalibacterium sp.]